MCVCVCACAATIGSEVPPILNLPRASGMLRPALNSCINFMHCIHMHANMWDKLEQFRSTLSIHFSCGTLS